MKSPENQHPIHTQKNSILLQRKLKFAAPPADDSIEGWCISMNKKEKLIASKTKGNGMADVLHPMALQNGRWNKNKQAEEESSQEKTIQQAEGSDISHPSYKAQAEGPSRDQKPYGPGLREVWKEYTAAACLLLLLGAAVFISFQHGEPNRNLASDLELEEEQQKTQQKFLNDLSHGRRGLSSYNQYPLNESSLSQREDFEHDKLKDYYVSYDVNGYVSEIQLKPDADPIYIRKISSFLRRYRALFPPHKRIVPQSQHVDEEQGHQVELYSLIGAFSSLEARTDSENMLVSIAVESEE